MIRRDETQIQVLQPGSISGTAADGIGAGLIARGRQNPTGGQSGGSRGGNRSGGNWNRRSDDEDKSKLVCSHCKRKRHTKDSCFELIGYPDWWEEKHGKPPSRAPWNRAGHAAMIVGDPTPGGQNLATTGGNQPVAQARGGDKETKPGAVPSATPAVRTGAANFVAGGSGSVIGDWSDELGNEAEAAPNLGSGYPNRGDNWAWH
ncbi:uncharacterized protein LOC125190976 [Salvia hispanica]|uniref:uncharacterized protein LOC125190976 n=1 Tax=Salvia hispanica TaxID=49212 RepID=UPI0020091B90|nr:uncharacterized protein LOC125190976 [Salvia hispanica]